MLKFGVYLKENSQPAKPDELHFKTIATAILQHDRLFRIGDSTKFLNIEKIRDVTSTMQSQINHTYNTN